MKISFNQQVSYKPSFGEWRREVYKSAKLPKTYDNLLYRTDTTFFRPDVHWEGLTQLISEKCKNNKKVRIYNYACSDGSETFSLLMSLISHLPEEEVKKITPIIAKDIDEEAIRRANSRIANITEEEKKDINLHTNNNFETFFTPTEEKDYYIINPILTDKIKYSRADIQKDYRKIKYKNSVLLLRNFWPYLGFENTRNLAKKITKRMKETTLMIIGYYDTQYQDESDNFLIGTMLKEFGLKRTEYDRIYKKDIG